MSKLMIISIVAMFSVSTFARSTLICKSMQKVDGWQSTETHDYVLLTAYVRSNSELLKAEIKGAYSSDVRDLAADQGYRPRSEAYKNFNRFRVLEDSWHWFDPILPKNLLGQKGPFTGYVQITGEEGFLGTVKMNCFIKR